MEGNGSLRGPTAVTPCLSCFCCSPWHKQQLHHPQLFGPRPLALCFCRLSSSGRLAPCSSGVSSCRPAHTGLVSITPRRLPCAWDFLQLWGTRHPTLWLARYIVHVKRHTGEANQRAVVSNPERVPCIAAAQPNAKPADTAPTAIYCLLPQICHAVAASASPDAGPWPELLPAVINTAQVIFAAWPQLEH